jgi:hypothetical protein
MHANQRKETSELILYDQLHVQPGVSLLFKRYLASKNINMMVSFKQNYRLSLSLHEDE